jgi:hypothetical protein
MAGPFLLICFHARGVYLFLLLYAGWHMDTNGRFQGRCDVCISGRKACSSIVSAEEKGARDVETADIPRFLFMGMILHCGDFLSLCIPLPLLRFHGWRRFEGVIVARWRVIRYPTRTGERVCDASRRTDRGGHVLYDIGFVSIKCERVTVFPSNSRNASSLSRSAER